LLYTGKARFRLLGLALPDGFGLASSRKIVLNGFETNKAHAQLSILSMRNHKGYPNIFEIFSHSDNFFIFAGSDYQQMFISF
jgi:hypothetical protein